MWKIKIENNTYLIPAFGSPEDAANFIVALWPGTHRILNGWQKVYSNAERMVTEYHMPGIRPSINIVKI